VKKSAKSRKPGHKSGQRSGKRTAKPQLQAAGWTATVPKSPANATDWLNSLRPPASETQVIYRLEPQPKQSAATARPIMAARAASTYDTDDRGTIFLMMVPFLVIALSLGISQTVKPFITSLPAPSISARTLVAMPVPLPVVAQRVLPPVAPVDQAALAAQRLAAWTPPALPWPRDYSPPRIDVPPTPVSTAPMPRPIIPPVIIAPPIMTLPDTPPLIAGPPITRPIAPDAPQFCERAPPLVLPVMGRSTVPPPAVGSTIASAAVAQTKGFVVYSAKYQRLSYPMGDLASFYGACSDVIIRAYRTIGLDLQELVQRTRAGRGDSNIDHRRTETLRKFFTQYGESLTPTAFPEDYQPGDIVTYYRPFSRVSRAHIAVVSDVRAPTGRFMIVHNRGWGPQLEDALFVDKITGHYRFDGTKLPPATTTSATRPSIAALPVALRPHTLKPGQLSRAPMLTPTSAAVDLQR
jgi:uncharacterized protein YijF (DUF1287 family)